MPLNELKFVSVHLIITIIATILVYKFSAYSIWVSFIISFLIVVVLPSTILIGYFIIKPEKDDKDKKR